MPVAKPFSLFQPLLNLTCYRDNKACHVKDSLFWPNLIHIFHSVEHHMKAGCLFLNPL